MTLRTRFLSTTLAAAAVFALSGPARAEQPPIKIGSFLAVTGPLSFVGDPEAKTLKLMVEQINAAGGVLGRKIELHSYDSGGDARQAVSYAKRLIEQDGVDVIVGGSSSGETLAVIPTVEEAEIPFISLAAANAIVEPVKKWVFKIPHSYRMAVDKIFGDMQRRDLSKVGIIAGSGGADQDCRREAQGLAGKYGITIVADETYAPSDTDMTPQLTRIRGSAGVQALLGCGSGAPTIITVRNYQQLGMQALPFYFQHGIGSRQFIDQAGAAAEGIRVPVPALLVGEQLPAGDPQREPIASYDAAYGKAYNEPVSGFGGFAHDGLAITLAAIKTAGTSDKAKLRDAIEKTSGHVGVGGIFTMSPTDHMGLYARSFKLVEIRNGAWKLME